MTKSFGTLKDGTISHFALINGYADYAEMNRLSVNLTYKNDCFFVRVYSVLKCGDFTNTIATEWNDLEKDVYRIELTFNHDQYKAAKDIYKKLKALVYGNKPDLVKSFLSSTLNKKD